LKQSFDLFSEKNCERRSWLFSENINLRLNHPQDHLFFKEGINCKRAYHLEEIRFINFQRAVWKHDEENYAYRNYVKQWSHFFMLSFLSHSFFYFFLFLIYIFSQDYRWFSSGNQKCRRIATLVFVQLSIMYGLCYIFDRPMKASGVN